MQTDAHELSGGVFYFLLFPPDLGRGQLWHDQIGGRAEQAGGEKQQRQDHTLDDAVTRQRRVGGQTCRAQATRDQKLLQRCQGAARVGRQRERHREAQHA